MSEFLKSRLFKVILICLGALILLIGSFSLGVTVGERKARHFSGFVENYGRMFPEQRRGPPENMPFAPLPLPDTHGVFGKVLSVSGQSLVVQGRDGMEQNVLVTSSTEIRIGRDRGTIQDVKPDADASVFGAANDKGQIEARLIRLFAK
jgi:hypothetical protein